MTEACAWCGKRAIVQRTVEPERFNGDGQLVRRAITAPVCREHVVIFDRAEQITDLQRERASLLRRLGKSDTAEIRAELERIAAELEQLGWVDTRSPRRTDAPPAPDARRPRSAPKPHRDSSSEQTGSDGEPDREAVGAVE